MHWSTLSLWAVTFAEIGPVNPRCSLLLLSVLIVAPPSWSRIPQPNKFIRVVLDWITYKLLMGANNLSRRLAYVPTQLGL